MNAAQVQSLVRSVLTFGGGFAVAHGWVTADNLPLITGAVVTLAGVIWSQVTHSAAPTA